MNESPIRCCKTCGRYVHEDLADLETGTCVYCEEEPCLPSTS